MVAIVHPLNWYAGWGLVLAGFMCGAMLGLFFHREDFWGGYASFRRRIVRLGHIAFVALGMLNVLFAVAVQGRGTAIGVASILMLLGGIAMPAVCLLCGWKSFFRHVFFVPVLCLMSAIILIVIAGPRAPLPSPGTPGEGQGGGVSTVAQGKPPPLPSPGVPGEGESTGGLP